MSKGQNVGYIRVSTAGQNTERQLEGTELDKVFKETASGSSTKERQVLNDCLDYLREGDTLHVHSIDRLARNLVELEQLVNQIHEKGATVHFHKENMIIDSNGGGSVGRLILQVIGAVAEFERSMIKERQAEGIASARKRGVKFGRPTKVTPEMEKQILDLLSDGIPKIQIAREVGLSRAHLYATLGRMEIEASSE